MAEKYPLTEFTRQRIFQRDLGLCAYCRGWADEIDHKTPPHRMADTWIADLWANSEDNLQAICGPCNRVKHSQTDFEYRSWLQFKRMLSTPPPMPLYRPFNPAPFASPLAQALLSMPLRYVPPGSPRP